MKESLAAQHILSKINHGQEMVITHID